MPDQLQLRGGTTAQHASFTGASKEITVDTTKKTVVVHDGSTAGGNPVMREDGSNAALALGSAASPSLKFTGDTNTGIYSPGADQLALSTNGTEKLRITSGGELDLPAGIGSQIRFENQHSVTTDAAISTFDDASGTLVCLGSNFYFNSAGSETRYNISEESAAIVLNRNGTIDLSTGDTTLTASTRLRITSAGLVGIGTSTPSGLFDARGFSYLSGAQIRDSSHVAKGYVQGDARGFLLATDGSTNIVFDVNGTERARIDTSGRLGIGTTSPAGALDIAAGGAGPSRVIVSQVSDNPYIDIYRSTGSGSNFAGFRLSTPSISGELAFSNATGATIGSHSFTERARIDSSGRLLVGTSTSVNVGSTVAATNQVTHSASAMTIAAWRQGGAGTLVLGGTSSGNTGAISANTTYAEIRFAGGDGTDLQTIGAAIAAAADGSSWTTDDGPTRLVFSTTADGASSPTERMRIDNIGRIGINTSPANFARLHVASDSDSYYPLVVDDVKTGTASATAVYFRRNTALVGTITTTNTATAYNTTSDYRLKENVTSLTGATDRLKQLSVHRFNFIADPDRIVDGFLAHEVQEVVPEAITGAKDEVDDDGKPIYQGIDQSKLVPLLTAALQEAVAKIESLEARLTAAGI